MRKKKFSFDSLSVNTMKKEYLTVQDTGGLAKYFDFKLFLPVQCPFLV